jgi:hypothetical protein
MPFTNDELRVMLKRPDLSDAQADEVYATLRWLAEAMIDTYKMERRRILTTVGGTVDDVRLAAQDALVYVVRIPRVHCRRQPAPRTRHLVDSRQHGVSERGIEPVHRKKSGKMASRKGMSRKIVANGWGSSSGMGVFRPRRSGELAFSVNLWSGISVVAPRCRTTNSALLGELVRWFEVLRTLPGLEAAVTGSVRG